MKTEIMIKLTDLRIGNTLWYDPEEGEPLITNINLQDLEWLSKEPKGFNIIYKPIPITEALLLRMGAKENPNMSNQWFVEGVYLSRSFKDVWSVMYIRGEIQIEIKYVHKLQNLIFAIKEKEVTIK